ncbi:hypothetical protein OEB99_04510 [Actinotalea sp. M2MS4P-6]|uniref:hypothetical protein n=1 Tax=Actinotalea sp. M2MS4P-6 TaxID=2983762 RepID=UPI0021E50818|nr:hypothetical protein [Actinotalea sp. M2MS4P-6]MCV2393562.1 hypothetical protein [Actinotalea sp. M2MS4P-6]
MTRTARSVTAVTLAGALAATAAAPALAHDHGRPTATGPSSSDAPYVVPAARDVRTTSILTAGDSVGGYVMSGLPDGLGAWDNKDGTFTLLANQELSAGEGLVRAHGATGAFVSRWVIDKRTLEVVSGTDQIQQLLVSDGAGGWVASTDPITRMCSADLPAASAFYDRATRTGYQGRIFMNGEETSGGRAFAHVVDTGDSYELPALGNAAWENVVANPSTGRSTVVVGTSDTGGGEVYVYAGTKQRTGNPVEKAGLADGTSWAISVPDLPTESGAAPVPSGPLPFELTAAGAGTGWDRPEDGSWDPQHPDDFYFVTTASMTKQSRLWRLRFVDAAQPELGGTVEMLLEGPADPTTGPKMMDNITVNAGSVLIQEDPGNNEYLAGIWQYDIRSGTVRRVADFDPERFLPGGSVFDTVDEESSGIIPAPFLGRGVYLFDAQNHTPVADPAVVQKGQLLTLTVGSGRSWAHDRH